MEQPSIFPFGIRIDEPVTTLTDLMVAAVCFYAFFRLPKYKINHRVYPLLRYYFLAMGLATTIGGIIGHGFLYALSREWKFPGWAISMVAINTIERVMIVYSGSLLKQKTLRFFSWFNILELVVFAILAFTTLNFFYVEIHSAYGLMIFVLGFSIYNNIKRKQTKAANRFIIAVALAAVASFFFMTGIGISPWYNHVDISHTFMTVSAWYFYLGAKAMLRELAPSGANPTEKPASTT